MSGRNIVPLAWGLLLTAGLGCGAAGERATAPAAKSRFEHFITRKADRMMDGEKQFRFIGAACTDLMGYVADGAVLPPDEFELRDTFESMCQMGQSAVRTYCFRVSASRPEYGAIGCHVIGNRKYNEEAFRGFDKALQLANEYGVRLIVPFLDQHNFGCHREAFARMHGKRGFLDDGRGAFKQFLTDLLNRRNTFTGTRYKDDKAILAWQLGNEFYRNPRLAEWESDIAAHLKKIDSNHLVASAYRGLHKNSLSDPNIDIIDYHPYPGPPRDIGRYWKAIKGKKAMIFGEFGGKGGAAPAKAFLERFIVSGVSGANWWALVPHSRAGGYGRWHYEGHQGYSRLHWPHWDDKIEKRHTVPGILAALQDAAFKLQGRKVPVHRCPVPRAPQLMPIDDPLRISWRGSAGARRYEIQRASGSAGEWATVGKDVSDNAVPGWFGRIFADPGAPGGPNRYRVRARNGAGVSPWSNVVEVGAPHPVMTRLYLGPNLLSNWSFEEGSKGWRGIDGKVASLTRKYRFSGATGVQFRNSKWHSLRRTVRLKPRTEYLWLFWCRRGRGEKVVGKILVGRKVISEGHEQPGSRRWRPYSLHFNSGTNTRVDLYAGVQGPEVCIDDMVLVENPQWIAGGGPKER